LNHDTERLGAFYHNHGFIEAKIGDPIVKQQGGRIHITFPIHEGPRYRVGTVEIKGDLIESKDKLMSLLKIRHEKFLNRKILRDDILRLTDLYAEHGYAFAEVRPHINSAPTSKRVDIVLTVTKGALVHFNRIEIEGNTRTRDNVIRRELVVKEGGIFDSKAIRKSTANLQRLDFFEDVSVTPKPTVNPDQMNVLVKVKEKSTGQFSVGAGYSSSDSLMFMSQISENNLMGTGNRLSLAANLSSISTRFNLSYTDPRVFDSEVLAGIDLYNWRRVYDDYTKDSRGGALRFGQPFFEKWRLFYSYSYATTTLSDIADNASWIIKQSEDIKVTSAIQIGLARDTRNRYYGASTGSKNTLSIKYAGGPFGGDAQFTKVEATSSWYFPLPLDCVFHIKGAAGQAFANESNKLPVYEHFYLGGLGSIRGFKSAHISPKDPVTGERIGGDKMWYGNIEVIFPLVKNAGLRGVVFTDFGNVYAVGHRWDFASVKKSVGIGFRWLSPMGPLRLAWGYNLDPTSDEDSSVWDFSIGGGF
ncbi:MAG TPA: outer membrane protein assembly factor BamA, partial [Desulfobacteraceae bacterium]|nr:outer membrane protein assembly factor BamA [Desulfobacteraceae bacterium]